jgi:hypothetical protein
MYAWKSLLKSDASEWLLEDENPSIRYFALRWLLDKAEDDPEVVLASQAIAESEPVQKFLTKQHPEGYWSDPRPLHGTRHTLLLMWLGYKGNGQIDKAIDYRIDGCMDEDGAFSITLKDRKVLLPCHGANFLGELLWYGYQEHPITKKLLNWLVQIQGDDGVWPCVSKLRPFSCMWATADVLRAYRDVPAEWLTPQIEESRILATELFLNSGLYQYKTTKSDPRWLKFGFPLRYDSDILDVLGILAPYIEPDDERIQPGLKIILEKQDDAGRWPCEKLPQGGKWMERFFKFEELGEPSKWVTLHAYKMLKTLYREN